jgi:hypothetical protein
MRRPNLPYPLRTWMDKGKEKEQLPERIEALRAHYGEDWEAVALGLATDFLEGFNTWHEPRTEKGAPPSKTNEHYEIMAAMSSRTGFWLGDGSVRQAAREVALELFGADDPQTVSHVRNIYYRLRKNKAMHTRVMQVLDQRLTLRRSSLVVGTTSSICGGYLNDEFLEILDCFDAATDVRISSRSGAEAEASA